MTVLDQDTLKFGGAVGSSSGFPCNVMSTTTTTTTTTTTLSVGTWCGALDDGCEYECRTHCCAEPTNPSTVGCDYCDIKGLCCMFSPNSRVGGACICSSASRRENVHASVPQRADERTCMHLCATCAIALSVCVLHVLLNTPCRSYVSPSHYR